MGRFVPAVVSQAREFYRRHGLLRLLRVAPGQLHRVVPFEYRLGLRRWRNRLQYGAGAVTRPLAVRRVTLDRIERNGPTFSHDQSVGTVRGGDWDLAPTAITDEEMYRGLSDRFAEGRDWEDTRYYRLAERNFAADGEWLGYTSFESFRTERLPYLDGLYRDIAENGYRSQSALQPGREDQQRHGAAPAYHDRINEVACNVARDGELLLNNGIHRVSIAKILGLESIPVQLIVRHRRWQETRSAVAASDRPVETAVDCGVDAAHPDLARFVPDATAPEAVTPGRH